MGTVSLLVTLTLYLLKREESYRDHLFVLLSFTGIILSETLGCYFDLTRGNVSIIVFLRHITILASCSLIYTLVRFTNSLVENAGRRLSERVSAAISITLTICILVTIPFSFARLFKDIALGVLGVSILYSVVMVIRHSRLKPEDKNLKAALIVALVTILVFPVFVVLDFYRLPLVPEGYPQRLWILPAFYIIWNVTFISVALRDLLAPKDISMTLEEERVRRFGLTPREQQVAELLMEGKRYREIAGLLDIAMPTVKTHISNIYDKTETRSRAALMHKLLNLP